MADCGHTLISPHAVCGNCKLHACDECADIWKVCISCGGGICERCEVSAQWRRNSSGSNEYICDPCGNKYRAARTGLIMALRTVVSDLERGNWVDTAIYDVEAAVAYAKEKAGL